GFILLSGERRGVRRTMLSLSRGLRRAARRDSRRQNQQSEERFLLGWDDPPGRIAEPAQDFAPQSPELSGQAAGEYYPVPTSVRRESLGAAPVVLSHPAEGRGEQVADGQAVLAHGTD